MANDIYNSFRQLALTGQIDLTTGTYKIAGVSGSYTFSQSHSHLSDLTGIVATSGSLTSLAVSGGKWSSADSVFAAATGSPIIALIPYKSTGTASTSSLVCYIDTDPTGAPINLFPTGIDLAITVPADGILNI